MKSTCRLRRRRMSVQDATMKKKTQGNKNREARRSIVRFQQKNSHQQRRAQLRWVKDEERNTDRRGGINCLRPSLSLRNTLAERQTQVKHGRAVAPTVARTPVTPLGALLPATAYAADARPPCSVHSQHQH